MDKNSLFMVTNDSPYSQRVPIQLGTLHIREALQLATEEERKSLPPALQTCLSSFGTAVRGFAH